MNTKNQDAAMALMFKVKPNQSQNASLPLPLNEGHHQSDVDHIVVQQMFLVKPNNHQTNVGDVFE